MRAAKRLLNRGVRRRKRLFAAQVATSAVLAAVPVAALGATLKLGYSAGFLTDPFVALLVHDSLALARQNGLTPLPATNANGDAAKQIADVHNLVAEGANALLIVPTDSQAIAPALSYAAAKKVQVVAIDTAPAVGPVAIVVRADNARMGAQACEQIGPTIHGTATVLSLMGDQATTNGRDRTTGFNTCMKSHFPRVKIIQEPTNWKADRAASITQTVVTSTPTLSGIYMQSDSVMLAGVLNVLRSAHKLRNVGEPGHIALVSIDGTSAALQAVRDGQLDAVISQPLNLYAEYGIAYVKRAVDHDLPGVGKTDHGSMVVDVDGIKEDLLPAPVVTKSNAGDPSLWGNKRG